MKTNRKACSTGKRTSRRRATASGQMSLSFAGVGAPVRHAKRARTGRDVRQLPADEQPPGFNPRAHTGRDCVLQIPFSLFQVSIHAPARGATTPPMPEPNHLICFNPRAHTGRDFKIVINKTSRNMFQSTRPHGARHLENENAYPKFQVSIHAPTRGATSPRFTRHGRPSFQSTRPHGARPSDRMLALSQYKFQSTRPHGARLQRTENLYQYQKFQSTRPHGARLYVHGEYIFYTGFQSTRPHGARRGCASGAWRLHSCFNPRARTGRDSCPDRSYPSCAGFQSTRPHGARHAQPAPHLQGNSVSIHAPARGATTSPFSVFNWEEVSIHAPARGATSISIGE